MIHREVMPFPDLVEKTRQKYVGLEELRAFFEEQARRLIEA